MSSRFDLSEVCRECGLTLIGPSPDVIRRMGDKAEALRTMVEAKVPTLPGSNGVLPEAGDPVAEVLLEGADAPRLDPELEWLKSHYCDQFRLAFHAALVDLPSREQDLLRQNLIEGMNIDRIDKTNKTL